MDAGTPGSQAKTSKRRRRRKKKAKQNWAETFATAESILGIMYYLTCQFSTKDYETWPGNRKYDLHSRNTAVNKNYPWVGTDADSNKDFKAEIINIFKN